MHDAQPLSLPTHVGRGLKPGAPDFIAQLVQWTREGRMVAVLGDNAQCIARGRITAAHGPGSGLMVAGEPRALHGGMIHLMTAQGPVQVHGARILAVCLVRDVADIDRDIAEATRHLASLSHVRRVVADEAAAIKAQFAAQGRAS